MTNICPRPCSRLATAAVFITAGVVQFMVGIILLKSKYVYLLAGPDFWTASSNIVVGSILGISASVWPRLRGGRSSAKYAVRRNVVSALMLSALVINATTAIILILGEGNTLLSIQLENNGKNQAATLAGEILAYAFAASVCSPILCVVIAILFLAGNCFQITDGRDKEKYITPTNVIEKDVTDSYKWVYTPEKANYHDSTLDSSKSSSSDDSPLQPNPDDDEFIDALYACALYKMAKAKRSRSMSDATIYRQRKPKYLRNCSSHKSSRVSFSDLNQNTIPRSYKSEHRSNKTYRVPSSRDEGNDLTSVNISNQGARVLSCIDGHKLKKNSSSPSEEEVFYDLPLNLVVKKGHSELKYHDAKVRMSKQLEDRGSCAAKNEECYSKVLAEVYDNGNKYDCDIDHPAKSRSNTYSVCNSIGIAAKNASNTQGAKKSLHYAIADPCATQNQDMLRAENVLLDCSDMEADSTFDASRISLAGDLVPIRVPSSTSKLVPASIPVVPDFYEMKHISVSELKHKRSIYGEPTMKSCTSVKEENGTTKQMESSSEKPLSSFQIDLGDRFQKVPLDYTRASFAKRGKSQDSTSKMSPMTPIPEYHSEEEKCNKNKIPSMQTSGYESSPEESSRTRTNSESILKELGNEDSESDDMTTPKKLIEIPNRESTPKRKNGSPRNVFRKFWSSAGTEAKMDFLDQIVDDDSLIGLTEQELIMRQLRNRSLRKIVEKRMKDQKRASESDDENSKIQKIESEV